MSETLPIGTVTLLSADIEGSTASWERLGDAYAPALEAQYQILREAMARHHGVLVRTEGDSFFAAFDRASDAVRTAIESQQALAKYTWPAEVGAIRVRMGLHTGEPRAEEGNYSGPAVNRATRIQSAAHGGQVLLSGVTCELARAEMGDELVARSLGRHRLKDLSEPEQLHEIQYAGMPERLPPPRTLEARPNNLPLSLTRFIGRERQVAEVKELLHSTRLLTLAGAGGCGKTRLALQVAAEVLDDFSDGVWLVELAALADGAMCAQSVAAVLGVREEPGRPLPATLTDHLKSRQVLLLLDNCEHLIGAAATLANTLLRACPQLRILATSREVLGIMGETAWRVPSLTLPEGSWQLTAGSSHSSLPTANCQLPTALQSEAVQLFLDRASLSQPRFAMTQQNAGAVAQVCRRLDGIPLAIELAAARVKLLSVEQIAARLDDRFRLLTGGSRAAMPRQQTLRATMDWSYGLLSEQERCLLRRLSVFVGGFMLEAAEVICSSEGVDEFEALDLLTQLVDKSLLVMEEHGGEAWYRLQETIRHYGAEQLVSSGEGAELRARHRDWYLDLASRAAPMLQGAEQAAWLQRLEREHDNVRAAIAWSREQGEVDAGLALVAALRGFWFVRGYLTEGREHLGSLFALAPPSSELDRARAATRAAATTTAGMLAYYQGDYPTARAHYEEAHSLYRRHDDTTGAGLALNNIGNVAYIQGNYDEARALYTESLAIHRLAGEKQNIASTLNNLGIVAQMQGDFDTAAGYYEEGLALRRELADPWAISASLNNLGIIAYFRGDFDRARALYGESLAIKRELGDRHGVAGLLHNLGFVTLRHGDPDDAAGLLHESLTLRRELQDQAGILESLEAFAGVAAARDRGARAARLIGAADVLREALGMPIPPSEQADHDALVDAARAGLDAATFDAERERGRLLPLEQAMAEALEEGSDYRAGSDGV